MDAHHLLARNGEESEGVVVAQVDFARERQTAQVVQRRDVFGRVDARLTQPLAHGCDRLELPANSLSQALELEDGESVARQGLPFAVPQHAATIALQSQHGYRYPR